MAGPGTRLAAPKAWARTLMELFMRVCTSQGHATVCLGWVGPDTLPTKEFTIEIPPTFFHGREWVTLGWPSKVDQATEQAIALLVKRLAEGAHHVMLPIERLDIQGAECEVVTNATASFRMTCAYVITHDEIHGNLRVRVVDTERPPAPYAPED